MTTAPDRPVPVWLSLTALAVGGFGIGTTEFATMGVLPDVAGDLGATIPEGAVVGRAFVIFWPVGRAGWLSVPKAFKRIPDPPKP